MPALGWEDILNIVGTDGEVVVSFLQPFLPALARAGVELYKGFLENLGKGDLDALVVQMWPVMTVEEREKLEAQVYLDAVEAIQASYDRIELMKSIAMKLAIALLTRVATGGLI